MEEVGMIVFVISLDGCLVEVVELVDYFWFVVC